MRGNTLDRDIFFQNYYAWIMLNEERVAQETRSGPQLVTNPMFKGCIGPCLPKDYKAPIKWGKVIKGAVGMAGNGGCVAAGWVLLGAPEPTFLTKVAGTYLIADGMYGFTGSSLEFSEGMGWSTVTFPENWSSIPRVTASLIAPNNPSAQRYADATGLFLGLAAGRVPTETLWFSARSMAADSAWSPAAQYGMKGYNMLQVYDGVDAAHGKKDK
ncbi:hypothetical protein KY495_06585 [Massilia sp. PAMC28688]|uniref:hypothetical protein n=1 Tax=Massilia sp. PAMC28688 TaxID=2861283 RepID=UPI001C62A654|nr:hypothetical protein [Massilia sp. PAMC28688]QYF94846.1 hypothetical protein KY495_06585 [Massilia sp. PAMC28688]